jgi:hypothetical protein
LRASNRAANGPFEAEQGTARTKELNGNEGFADLTSVRESGRLLTCAPGKPGCAATSTLTTEEW